MCARNSPCRGQVRHCRRWGFISHK